MKLGGRHIGRGVVKLRDRLSRARYFRGHGVHSPYIYRIVREVFMSGELGSGDTALYRELLAVGVAENRAIQLQNLMMHCGYATFGVNRADAELCIATRDLTAAETLALVRAAAQKGSTVALMSPCKGRARQSLCRRIAAEHPSTTVDNRGYLLIFNNHLPKQHFRI